MPIPSRSRLHRKERFNPKGMDERAIIYERQIPRGSESLSQEHLHHPEFRADLSGLKEGRPSGPSEKFFDKVRRERRRKKSFGFTIDEYGNKVRDTRDVE